MRVLRPQGLSGDRPQGLSGDRPRLPHSVYADMKKVLLTVGFIGMTIFGFMSIVWYAGFSWKHDGTYDIKDNSEVITLIKRNIFSNDCACLIFQKGTLYHGQDTFEVMKFAINQSDFSWNVVSNRLVALGEGSFRTECRDGDARFDLPIILRDVANDKEKLAGEFMLDNISFYVTVNQDTSLWNMYFVGAIIPVDQIDMIIR